MEGLELFTSLLSDFGRNMGEQLELTDDSCAFMVDGEVILNVQVLPDEEMVVLWSTVGILPEDEYSCDRARYLLEKQDFWRDTSGFTVGLDAEERRVVCHDIQEVSKLDTLDALAAWFDLLVEVIRRIRKDMEELYPSSADSDDDDLNEEVMDHE